MALKNLADWNEDQAVSVCGSACGATDEEKEEKPAACGSACGASSSCGTTDK